MGRDGDHAYAMQRYAFPLNANMVIPLFGWLYILYGCIRPFNNRWLVLLFWADVFLSVVVHACQIRVALPLRAHYAVSRWEVIVQTMLFGATWWLPLKRGLQRSPLATPMSTEYERAPGPD